MNLLPLPEGGPAPPAERFRALIAQRLGLRFEDDKLNWLEGLLRQRQAALGDSDVDHYLAALAQAPVQSEREWQALASELTVGETYFFRHVEQFHALRERLIPQRLRHTAGRPLRILSAGCASGEEPYSIAMMLADMPEMASHEARIDGVDLNPQALARARAARYRGWSLRETPDAVRDQWFHKEHGLFALDRRIRQAVQFSQRNLMDDEDGLFWLPGSIDIVMCRNVLMYFDAPQARKVLERFSRAMAPGGYLLLGHAETLRGLSTDFELCQSHGTFYHRRKTSVFFIESERQTWEAEPVRPLPRPEVRPPRPEAPGREPRAHRPSSDAELLALFAEERYGEAVKRMAESGPEAMPPRMQALHALLWLHLGSAEHAERLCRQQLIAHPLDADMHHALALCLATLGDATQAREVDQRAAFLDASFAMPHLHLALLWRQEARRADSRQAAAMALRLLPHEEPERILLFGGGFGRDALMEMCRSLLQGGGVAA